MDNQEIINMIYALTTTVDALTRADQKEAVKLVSEKILELIKKLK